MHRYLLITVDIYLRGTLHGRSVNDRWDAFTVHDWTVNVRFIALGISTSYGFVVGTAPPRTSVSTDSHILRIVIALHWYLHGFQQTVLDC